MTQTPPFEVIQPTGAQAPVVLDSPHSGFDYPDDFRSCRSLSELRRTEDSFVNELYAAGPRHGATLVFARFPRSYVDPNRSIFDIDASLLETSWPGPAVASRKTELGIGLIWRALDSGEPIYDRKLSVDEVRRRITQFHQPYQKAVRDAIDATAERFGVSWHLNCHSMPAVSSAISEEGPGKPRPDFVLGDRDGSTCEPEFTDLVKSALTEMGYQVRVNDPYKGVELVRAFSDPTNGRHSLQVEVNRRLYMDEETRAKSPGFARLCRDIERMLKAVCQYAAARGAQRHVDSQAHHDCTHEHQHQHEHGEGCGHHHQNEPN